MTKADIVANISEKLGMEKGDVQATIESFMDEVKTSLESGDNVYLRGFGSFVVKTRAEPLGIKIGKLQDSFDDDTFGILLQYPTSSGSIEDYTKLAQEAHENGSLVVVATDLLSLCLIKPPGEWGADIVVGNSQRFGVPMGFGGPHAAFMATREKYKRNLPGRLVGVSKDVHGNSALRLALQTREQHIRRDRATSNICTAQVLLAIMSSMYAVYHGPNKIRKIALYNLDPPFSSYLSLLQGIILI